jgi:mycothiol S-conjugate amidase
VTEPLRLLAVHAHPDDEASKGAATMARYVKEGADVMVVTCTGGERGDVLNPAAAADVEERGLIAVRRQEMADAVQALGIQHRWLGFVDSGYPAHLDGGEVEPLPAGCFADIDVHAASAPLIDIVREFRPHVMTTYDENGGYPHPDHIRTHEVAMEAFTYADDLQRYPGGEPWRPMKLYYNMTFHRARVEAMHAAMVDAGIESPFAEWIERWAEWPDDAWRITTRIPVADYFGTRDEALLAHRTQVDPQGMWFAMPRDLERDVWPTEDFQLAISRIPVDIPEDDLFAGIREETGR